MVLPYGLPGSPRSAFGPGPLATVIQDLLDRRHFAVASLHVT
jgi:hypothetical protein